ncbi:MAG: hypothetical protein ACYCZX_17810 [Rhodospirillaceae bacterium]
MIRKQPVKPVPKLFGLQPARKAPRFTDQLKRFLKRHFAKTTPAQHVAKASARVLNAYRNELAGIFAAVLLAKKTFDATRQVDLPFPEGYFDGTAAVDAAGRKELEAYAAALETFHEQCMDGATALSYATAQGVEIWIASVYGLARSDLTEETRRMWMQLVKGEENIEEAFKLIMRRDPSDLDREYFKYRPVALIG